MKTDLWDEAVGGGLYPVLSGRARAVAGVDVSGSVVEAASARYPDLRALHADVRHLPFEDAHFDVIVSTSTLDHFKSPREIGDALDEVSRVLHPAGTLIVTLDNPVNPMVAIRNAVPQHVLDSIWRRFGPAALRLVPTCAGATCRIGSLRKLLLERGLEPLDATAIMHCPRALAVMVADLLERRSSTHGQQTFLRLLARFERLERLPTRYVTGYFIAMRAMRSGAADPRDASAGGRA